MVKSLYFPPVYLPPPSTKYDQSIGPFAGLRSSVAGWLPHLLSASERFVRT